MRHFLLVLILAAGAAGCQAPSTPSITPPPAEGVQVGAFFKGASASGVLGPFDLAFEEAVDSAQDTVIVVFNDGTGAVGKDGACLPGNMPRFIRDWGRSGIDGHDVVVFYLCSDVVETTAEVLGQERAEEDKALLDRLIALGVPPEHIFILGHSSGASAALLAAGQAPGKFNAAVVAAPGYGYAYAEGDDRSAAELQMLERLNETWRGALARLDRMSALVYLFEGDTYTPPDDAMFLADLPGIELIVVGAADATGALCPGGPRPHFYWWSSCFREDGKKTIEAYIVDRLQKSEPASS